MDGLESVRICIGYKLDGKQIDLPPYGAESMARCVPVYEDLPGWSESTEGVREYDRLPHQARAYLDRVAQLMELPIDIVSTGAERDDTIILRHPFA
jgi:adenylosuccinate synthase